jgi:hypothetical protein
MVDRIRETVDALYPSAEEVMRELVDEDIIEQYSSDPSQFSFILNGNNRTAIRKAENPDAEWVSKEEFSSF